MTQNLRVLPLWLVLAATLIACAGPLKGLPAVRQRLAVLRQPTVAAPARRTTVSCEAFEVLTPVNPVGSVRSGLGVRWSAQAQIDATCPTAGTVSVSRSEAVAAEHPPTDSNALRENIDFLIAGLQQLQPAPKVRLTGLKAAVVSGKLNVSGDVNLSELKVASASALVGAVTRSLEQVVSAEPLQGATLCINLSPLAEQLRLRDSPLAKPWKINVPQATLEAVVAASAGTGRVGAISLEDGQGNILAEQAALWPGLLRTSASQCGCSLLVEFGRARTSPVAVSFELAHAVEKLAGARDLQVRVRFAAPGATLLKTATVEPAGSVPRTGSKVGDVLARSFHPGRLAAAEGSIAGNANVLAGAWFVDPRELKAGLATLGAAPEGDKLCIQGSDGATVGAIRLAPADWKELEGLFTDLAKVKRVGVLNLRAAGLSEGGQAQLALNPTEQRMVQRVASDPNGAWRVRLNKTLDIDNNAHIKVPVELSNGKDEMLRVKVDMSSQFVAEAADIKILFEAPDGVLQVPLSRMPSAGNLYAALTTPWGSARVVKVPRNAITLEGDPVDLKVRGGERSVLVTAGDGAGRILDAVEAEVPLHIAVDRPMTTECSMVLRPAAGAVESVVSFSAGTGTDRPAGITFGAYDLQRQSVRLRYLTPQQCAAGDGCTTLARSEPAGSASEAKP